MTKIILIMYLCSGIPGNRCGVIPTPKVLFNDHYSCMVYAPTTLLDQQDSMLLAVFPHLPLRILGCRTEDSAKLTRTQVITFKLNFTHR